MDRENRKFLKKLSACVAVLFVIVTVVSLCVMNFTPINRLLGGYKEQPLDLSHADGANITYNDDGTITLGEGYSEIEFTGIDARVGSIGFDVDFGESANSGKVYVDFADSTSSYYRTNIAKLTLENGLDNVMTCNFSGEVSRLRLEISLDDYHSATLKGITLNQSISALHIAEIILTYLLIAAAAIIIIYAIANPAGARKKFSDNRVNCARHRGSHNRRRNGIFGVSHIHKSAKRLVDHALQLHFAGGRPDNQRAR